MHKKTQSSESKLWAQAKPEARTYYELAAATLKFVFPRPGFLEGIKGRSQAITKMTNVRPCYPLCQF